MKASINIWFTVILLLLAVNNASAQNMTVEQKEVWSGIQKYWEAWVSGNVQSFRECFDESYSTWSHASNVPQTKASTIRWIEDDIKKNKAVFFTISPLTIWVKGEFAFVNYYYSQVYKNKETSKERINDGNFTDILVKKEGKWLLVGDHGGRTPKTQLTSIAQD